VSLDLSCEGEDEMVAEVRGARCEVRTARNRSRVVSIHRRALNPFRQCVRSGSVKVVGAAAHVNEGVDNRYNKCFTQGRVIKRVQDAN
jgi:hypothetical protein